MGIYSTERNLFLNDTIRGCFLNSKFIGEEDDPESLQRYLNQFVNVFVNNQLFLFPNGQRMIDSFIILDVFLLDRAIINNEITISEMPAVQLSALLLEHDKVFEQYKNN